jgi:hypothetical protein
VTKNVGVEEVKRRHPGAYYVGMDDDDFYGENYLREHVMLAEHGQVAGKWNGFVQFDDYVAFFPVRKEPERFIGGTIGCYVSEAPEFPDVVAEEGDFCRAFEKKQRLSHLHFVYNRSGDPKSHVWKAREEKLWRRLGGEAIKLPGAWQDWIECDEPEGKLQTYEEALCL